MKSRGKQVEYRPDKYNLEVQVCCGVSIRLILYTESHFARLNAKRYMLVDDDGHNTNQNIWIPNSYLSADGTVDPQKDLSWKFKSKELRVKLEIASKFARIQGNKMIEKERRTE